MCDCLHPVKLYKWQEELLAPWSCSGDVSEKHCIGPPKGKYHVPEVVWCLLEGAVRKYFDAQLSGQYSPKDLQLVKDVLHELAYDRSAHTSPPKIA